MMSEQHNQETAIVFWRTGPDTYRTYLVGTDGNALEDLGESEIAVDDYYVIADEGYHDAQIAKHGEYLPPQPFALPVTDAGS